MIVSTAEEGHWSVWRPEDLRTIGEISPDFRVYGICHHCERSVYLDHLALAGCSPQSLPLDIIFSFVPGVVTDVWCQGTEVVSHGYHRAENQAQDNLRRVLTKLREGVPK